MDKFKEFLRWVYWDLGYSTHEMAKYLQTNQPTICRLMDVYGISRRARTSKIPYRVLHELSEKLHKLTREERGSKIRLVAEQYGVRRETVYHRLRVFNPT